MSKSDMPRILARDIEKAEDVDFTENEQNWNVYTLSDGTTLKVKSILLTIKRMKKWKRDGTPIYLLHTENITRISDVPKKLKGKPKPSAYQSC